MFAKANTYDYHIATEGSIAVISGSGSFKSVSLSEDISHALGTAYVITSTDDEHLSLHYFKSLSISEVGSEEVAAFYLNRVGGWALKSSTITQSYDDSSFRNKFKISNLSVYKTIWTEAYLETRLVDKVNYKAGTVLAVQSYYDGYTGTASQLDVTVDGTSYGVIPDSSNSKYLWMKDNKIFN